MARIGTMGAVVGFLSAAIVAPAGAGLVLDQEVDIFVSGTSAFDSDVTMTLYETHNGGLNFADELYSATLIDIPRGTYAEFRFDAFALVPEREYYMLFELSDRLVIGSGSGDPYDRGEVLVGGGNIASADLAFRTYEDDGFVIPAPGTAAALLVVGAAARRRRQA